MITRNHIIILVIVFLTILASIFVYRQTSDKQVAETESSIFDENDLIGGWETSLADPADPECKSVPKDTFCIPNDTEELNFSFENGIYTYNSYLHHRPDDSNCSWKLKNDTISINCSTFSKSIKIIDLSNEILILEREGVVTQYQRIE